MKFNCELKTKNYCPLGKEWYTNNFMIEYTTGKIIDFLEIQEKINERINNKNLIIEEAVSTMFELFSALGVKDLKVKSLVDDAIHFKVEVSI